MPDDPLDQPEETGYALVMPFVVVASNGGPYDDDAFVAGWQGGRLDRALAVAAVNDTPSVRATVHAALVPQLELLGMNHGYPTIDAALYVDDQNLGRRHVHEIKQPVRSPR